MDWAESSLEVGQLIAGLEEALAVPVPGECGLECFDGFCLEGRFDDRRYVSHSEAGLSLFGRQVGEAQERIKVSITDGDEATPMGNARRSLGSHCPSVILTCVGIQAHRISTSES